ncbi:MAG: DegV family protein [Oscillospiraceae bacterium]|jgi:DegV family protein with EDD domain|nr:DegV family protein [Oscillospiraceae bacterium]
MKCGIVVDSCCDMTTDMRETMDITSVPLTMRLGKKEYSDDEALDHQSFMADMKACTDKVSSASPSPYLYACAMEKKISSFVITLSSQLSGSYSSALIGKAMAEEKQGVSTHIFDSKSASAGQTLVALKLHEILSQLRPKEEIIRTINRFIDNMKTYFVLERYDNLQKNGRLNRIAGSIASILNIKLLMGSDGNGNITLYAKLRGITKVLDRLLSLIEESGKDTTGEDVVIAHCNNPSLAQRLADAIKERFHFARIHIVPTGGLSSLYADDQGIIMAF